jgi:hypothetical protein
VFKLMAPHYRFTLDINFKGRGSLINAGGIIESVFTPGAAQHHISCRKLLLLHVSAACWIDALILLLPML